MGIPQKGIVGSNPILSATLTRKVRPRALRVFYVLNWLIPSSIAASGSPTLPKTLPKIEWVGLAMTKIYDQNARHAPMARRNALARLTSLRWLEI